MKLLSFFIFLFLTLSLFSFTVISDEEGPLILTITNVSWEITSVSEGKTNFYMSINVTVDNISNRKIKITFPNSCLFDVYINYDLNDSKLQLNILPEICLCILLEATFRPGPTLMSDGLSFSVNNSSLTDLPDGSYEVILGESFASRESPIDKAAKVNFQINNGTYLFQYEDRPIYKASFNIKAVIFSPILFYMIIYILMRRNKIKR